MDKKLNVLLLGNSGVGKSTLINAVLAKELAASGAGRSVTSRIAVYETEEIPFRLIDTPGLENGFLKKRKLISSLRKWSSESVKKKREDRFIHAVWYCIDASSRRLFYDNLNLLYEVSAIWKDIPVIVVFTKSYSETEAPENEQLFRLAFEREKKRHMNLKGICSVVAKPFVVNETTVIPERGLPELIALTNELLPEADRLSREAVGQLERKLKRARANSLVGLSVAAAGAVGAAPIPAAIPDAAVLVPLQARMLSKIRENYGISNENELANVAAETLVASGGVTLLGRQLFNTLKMVPGVNVAASVLSALVAASLTGIMGEISIALMEGIVSGRIRDVDFIKTFVEKEYDKKLLKYGKLASQVLKKSAGKDKNEVIRELIRALRKPGEPGDKIG